MNAVDSSRTALRMFAYSCALFILMACSETTTPIESESMEVNIPAEFLDISNPFSGELAELEGGQEIYDSNCVSCHGESGDGKGSIASSMDPAPGSLQSEIQGKGDEYLYWRIAEGGMHEPFNSLMPAWKNILDEEQIWKTISYIRTFSE